MNLVETLKSVLGPAGWIAPDAAPSYCRDWLDRYGTAPILVARPATTAEVAGVVRACAAAGVAIVPQGGNTSLCGGAVAQGAGAVLLSLSRMTRIGPVSGSARSIEVEAGCILADLHAALADHDVIFPMHLGAEGSARIGGLISTNAGGSQAFRYGMMSDLVLGLEVVLPDGEVWTGLRHVQKDNAGYQLRRLFAGAEGTFGVITRAVLRLYPAPRRRATALIALSDAGALDRVGDRLGRAAGDLLSAAEFLSDTGVAMALDTVAGLTLPLDTRSPFYVLVELAAGSDLIALDNILETLLAEMFEDGLAVDGVLAQSEAQRAALWRLREELPEGQRLSGPQMKHDISLPLDGIGRFIDIAARDLQNLAPGLRINPFGHLADGNIHYNLSPAPGAEFGPNAADLSAHIYGLAEQMGGSFAAEHGLGRAKVALADALRPATERTLMRRLRAALDPDQIMNPNVITRPDPEPGQRTPTENSQ
jgi:FAD/FMN-containing dehydrogenase